MKFESKPAKAISLVSFLAVIVIGSAVVLTACSRSQAVAGSDEAKAKTLYTCGMHPQVVQDYPGNCSICGMKLSPIRKQAGATATAGTSSGERKIKYYKSTMMPGEVRQTPGKDSMGMDMVAVYEAEAAAAESQV